MFQANTCIHIRNVSTIESFCATGGQIAALLLSKTLRTRKASFIFTEIVYDGLSLTVEPSVTTGIRNSLAFGRLEHI